ncbi:MAG: hydrolase, partial [Ruminococcaceae bacterium]|nr:hydrolase [Oscillospiraceae bacterium]
MPKIGMRIIKSSVAVFLCFAIYLVRGDGIPFYSAIAAILCMQPYVSNSRKVAFNRIIGTFIGGTAGMLVMMAERSFIPPEVPVLKYLLISAVIIPLIYITVLAKKTSASYITCVVFMSITVSHGQDASPYFFALNRILDTLIGIFVSLGVNAFHLPRRKNGDLLFVSDLDGTLTNS